jgi:membrane associated rhomboid family serine protease
VGVLISLVWRLFTGLFVHTQFLELLFSLISYIPQAIQVENEIGTVRMLHRFLLFGILINIIFTAIVAPTGIRQMSIGLWPMLMVDIVS